MTSLREHHFVPQFYLRRFASPGAAAIALFHLPSRRFVASASIKGQCRERDLYSKDTSVEKLLGGLEGLHAQAFRQVTEAGEVTPGNLELRARLLEFAMLQYGRTTARRNEMAGLVKEMLRVQVEIEEKIDIGKYDSVKVGFTNWVDGVFHALVNIPIALDLEVKLLKTDTGALITSDNPIVLQNRYLAERHRGGGRGWACAGLQVLFPIDRCHALAFFDPATYRVGSPRAGVVRMSRKDTDRLNEMQVLNALEHVYFPPSFDEVGARRLVEPLLSKRSAVAIPVRQYLEDGVGSGRYAPREERELPERGAMLLHAQATARAPDYGLSFVEIHARATRRALSPSAEQVRSGAHCDAHQAFVKNRGPDLRSGRISLSTFLSEACRVLGEVDADDDG